MGRIKGEDEIESEGGETVRCVSLFFLSVIFFQVHMDWVEHS